MLENVYLYKDSETQYLHPISFANVLKHLQCTMSIASHILAYAQEMHNQTEKRFTKKKNNFPNGMHLGGNET